MAKNGAFLASAAKVDPRWHTPVLAIIAQGICTMIMTLTPFPQLVIYIGFLLNFFAVMSVASLIHLRRQPGWRKLRVVSFCYPLFPILFILVGLSDDRARCAIRKPYCSRSRRSDHRGDRSAGVSLPNAGERALGAGD